MSIQLQTHSYHITDFWPTCVRSESRLRSHLRLSSATKGADPRCRFMYVIVDRPYCKLRLTSHYRFLNGMGGSSRAKLQTTREMLMLSFTYAHVMPEFVEFLFSFGYQSSAQDPYFSSFRQRFGLNQKLVIPELAWSGNEIQMCYNLKSAERSASSPSDWSIRDCAVHHILDLKNPRANWIIVKGNEMMKNRIEQATGDHDDMSTYETVAKAFSASLLIHLLFCEWAAEQWRWYIINLEEQFQNTSQRALTAPVALRTSPTIEQDEFQMTARTETQKTNGSLVARVSRTQTMLTEKLKIAAPKPKPTVQHTYTDPESGLSQPLPPNITVKDSPDSDLQQPEPDFEDEENQMFSFARLQQMQHIEEKIHETLLILRLNISIMQQIKQYYDTVTKSHHFPRDVFQLCQDDINHFELRINGIVNNLQMQILRLETLLRLLGDRKNLVSQIIQSVQGARLRYDQLGSILEYRNTQLNKESTKNMMSMTEDMNEIARKTKIETVSMKVITVVTLFFLPGTFISVRDLVLLIYFTSNVT